MRVVMRRPGSRFTINRIGRRMAWRHDPFYDIALGRFEWRPDDVIVFRSARRGVAEVLVRGRATEPDVDDAHRLLHVRDLSRTPVYAVARLLLDVRLVVQEPERLDVTDRYLRGADDVLRLRLPVGGPKLPGYRIDVTLAERIPAQQPASRRPLLLGLDSN